MKVVLCGSVLFPEKIKEVRKSLEERGHQVVIPYSIVKHNLCCFGDSVKLRHRENFIRDEKPFFTRRHFDEIKEGDAILVVNVEKDGIPDYIGGATFAEMVFAFYLKKKIFLLNPIPDHEKVSVFHDEMESMQPVILGGNLDLVK